MGDLHRGRHGSRQGVRDLMLTNCLAALRTVQNDNASPAIHHPRSARYVMQWLSERDLLPLETVTRIDSDQFKRRFPEWSGYVAADKFSAGGPCPSALPARLRGGPPARPHTNRHRLSTSKICPRLFVQCILYSEVRTDRSHPISCRSLRTSRLHPHMRSSRLFLCGRLRFHCHSSPFVAIGRRTPGLTHKESGLMQEIAQEVSPPPPEHVARIRCHTFTVVSSALTATGLPPRQPEHVGRRLAW